VLKWRLAMSKINTNKYSWFERVLSVSFIFIFSTTLNASVPTGLKTNLFIQIPKDLNDLTKGVESPSKDGVSVTLRLLSPNGCILATENMLRDIVSGHLTVFMGKLDQSGQNNALNFPSSVNASSTKQKLLQISSNTWNNNALSLSGLDCYQQLSVGEFDFSQPPQSGGSYNAQPHDSRYLMVELTLPNSSNQFVPIKIASEIGASFFSRLAEKALLADEASTVADGSISSQKLASGAVTTNKIEDGAVTNAKLSQGINVNKLDQSGASIGQVLTWNGLNWSPQNSSGGGGTVSSVGVTVPSFMSATGTPITTSGNINLSFNTQNQGHVLAAPNSSNGVPTFRLLRMSDIRSSATGNPPFFNMSGSCPNGQFLTYNAVTDQISCQNYVLADGAVTNSKLANDLDASKITQGTIDSQRLPTATSTQSGVVNTLAQSFAGLKTFINGIHVSENASFGGVIKIGSSSAPCDSSLEGSVRYNSSIKQIQLCNGTQWQNIGSSSSSSSSSSSVTITIGNPSPSLIKSGNVTYSVAYGGDVLVSSINLSASHITLNGSDITGCAVSSVTGSGVTRTLTISGCSGTGDVSIWIASGTAQSNSSTPAPSAGPSASFNVDNSGPSAPTNIVLGSVPSSLTQSPTISWGASSDVGTAGVSQYEVQVLKSDNTVVRDWTTHSSGVAITSGLNLTASTQYYVKVRAIDSLGNIGSEASSSTWTTPSGPSWNLVSSGTMCEKGSGTRMDHGVSTSSIEACQSLANSVNHVVMNRRTSDGRCVTYSALPANLTTLNCDNNWDTYKKD